ncbi:ATP-binding cassette domain-containing protein [Streptomyces carpinensis]|uniref:ATP-binding cassette domain-containing protein n=1 Tax=Streptomyces carpinensis TaxID=66369 RepID=A0ABV1W7H1_9ACTN|nr:ATP-binding cassette domain-containing protein [Streptomyces carpinensis]
MSLTLHERAQYAGAPLASPAPAPAWTLSVRGLGKIYGDTSEESIAGTGPEFGTAVSPNTGAIVAAWGVDLDVAPGEALGVIGESGSGKSTVLRCIAGDEPATAGEMLFTDHGGSTERLDQLSPTERRRMRISDISVVYQDPALGLTMDVSAGGNVADPLTAAGWRNFGRIRSRATELLQRTEVPIARMDHPVKAFSGGMKQRVQIAKSLANDPSLLLLDEPTTGLDASVAAGVLDLMRGLLEETNVAAIVVSHDFSVIEMLTTRVIVMQHGRVVEAGLTDQLLEDPQHPYSQQLVAAARG